MGNETFYINKLNDMNICFKSTQSSFTGLSIKPKKIIKIKNKIMLIILLQIKQIKIIKNIIKKYILKHWIASIARKFHIEFT